MWNWIVLVRIMLIFQLVRSTIYCSKNPYLNHTMVTWLWWKYKTNSNKELKRHQNAMHGKCLFPVIWIQIVPLKNRSIFHLLCSHTQTASMCIRLLHNNALLHIHFNSIQVSMNVSSFPILIPLKSNNPYVGVISNWIF